MRVRGGPDAESGSVKQSGGSGGAAKAGSAGFTLIELVMIVGILSIVAALAVPNYVRYTSKTRQSEARNNLAAIFASEIAHFAEASQYGTFRDIGFVVAGTGRYAYRVGAGAIPGTDLILPGIGADPGDNAVVGAGIAGAPSPGFTATATANLDTDPIVDSWHVNDIKETLLRPDTDDSIL